MTAEYHLLSYEDYNLHARQYESGARQAAMEKGITVIIDVFRASSTILELLDAGARVVPVTTIDEAMSSRFSTFVKVGEDEGVQLGNFDFDNSPVMIHANKDQFRDRDVVIRTTNGTRGILAAQGSHQIIVGSFRNFHAVVNYCVKALEQNFPVSFVGMGTLEKSRIEDDYCARMFVISVLEELGETELLEDLKINGNNPWNRDWQTEIMDDRGDTDKVHDYKFSLHLDETPLVPVYNPSTGYLDLY